MHPIVLILIGIFSLIGLIATLIWAIGRWNSWHNPWGL